MTTKSTFTLTIDWKAVAGTLFLATLTLGFVWIMNKCWADYNVTAGVAIFYIVELYRRLTLENKDT